MPRAKDAFDAMREQTRQKIETAALSLFARKGLSVTVGEIARAAGVSHGLMYSHYESKEALIEALTRQAVMLSAQSIKEVAQAEEAAAVKIRQITDVMCEMLTVKDHPGTHTFMFMIQVGMSGFPMQEMTYDVILPNPIESLAQIIAAGQAEGTVTKGDPIQLAMLFWATIQGLCCYVVSGMQAPICPETLAGILVKENSK